VSFSIPEVLKESLETTYSRKGVTLAVLFFVCLFVQDITVSVLNPPLISPSLLSSTGYSVNLGAANLILLLLAISSYVILTVISLRVFLGEELSSEIVDTDLMPQAVLLFALGAVTTAAVLAGSLLLVLPGIFLAVSLFFYPAYIARNEGLGSLKKSWRISRGNRFKIFFLMAILVILTTATSHILSGMRGELTVLLASSFETVFGIAALTSAFRQVKDE